MSKKLYRVILTSPVVYVVAESAEEAGDYVVGESEVCQEYRGYSTYVEPASKATAAHDKWLGSIPYNSDSDDLLSTYFDEPEDSAKELQEQIGCSNPHPDGCGFKKRGCGWQCVEGAACGYYLHPGDQGFDVIQCWYEMQMAKGKEVGR
jgi:hypothetical protein